MTSQFDLTGKHALITGGGSGLGLAIAHGFAQHGASITLLGRTKTKLDQAVQGLADKGALARAFVHDVTETDASKAAVSKIETESGPVDILVNNAGVQHRGKIAEFSSSDWHRMIDTHLTASFFMSQAVASGMMERRKGKIINILSVLSELGRPNVVAYAAAKGGLKMMTKGLAAELGPHNIQVNGIGPGYFATEMNDALVNDKDFFRWIEQRTPAGRWGEPHELAGAAIFLASAASNFVTGQAIYVDGGMTSSI